ncbi:unnamed protein product [Haemonchus placei]|uniref:Uncharacterized protein n=1 Tax=Haemonchus placei TaxID=6290 RepID=A0A3P8BAD6_HAEPC|nr:unnamed protein product [Haemonchus placei]
MAIEMSMVLKLVGWVTSIPTYITASLSETSADLKSTRINGKICNKTKSRKRLN